MKFMLAPHVKDEAGNMIVSTGSHGQKVKLADGREQLRDFSAGDIIESPYDLTQTFRNKFIRVSDSMIQTKGKPVLGISQIEAEADRIMNIGKPQTLSDLSTAPAVTLPNPAEINADGTITPPGKEVTERFPKAADEDMKVYKDGNEYFVYDADTMRLVNLTGVAKAEVDGVIDGAFNKK